MHKPYPYPEREHTTIEIETFDDALAFELSIHPNGFEFRYGLSAISKLYAASPLLRSMRQSAQLVGLSRALAGHAEHYPQLFDQDFYRGSQLGMHTVLRAVTRQARQAALMTDYFYMYRTTEGRYEFQNDDLTAYADGYKEWCAGGFFESLCEEPESFQQLIFESAMRMYDDVPNARSNEDAFMAGFMLAKDSIVSTLVNQGSYKRLDDV